MHPTSGVALRQFSIMCISLRQQPGGVLQADQGIEVRIDTFNAMQIGLHHLTARHLLGMNGLRESVGAEFGDNHAEVRQEENRLY